MRFRLVEEVVRLIGYNGSQKKFNKFSDGTKGETIGTENYDIPGIYFSSDKSYAINYAYGTTTGEWTDDNANTHTKTRCNKHGYLYTCKLDYRKPYVIDYHKTNDKKYWNIRENFAKDIDKYKEQGYDIVLLMNCAYQDQDGNLDGYYANEYVVLNPDIITIIKVEEVDKDYVAMHEDLNYFNLSDSALLDHIKNDALKKIKSRVDLEIPNFNLSFVDKYNNGNRSQSQVVGQHKINNNSNNDITLLRPNFVDDGQDNDWNKNEYEKLVGVLIHEIGHNIHDKLFGNQEFDLKGTSKGKFYRKNPQENFAYTFQDYILDGATTPKTKQMEQILKGYQNEI